MLEMFVMGFAVVLMLTLFAILVTIASIMIYVLIRIAKSVF